MIEYITTNNFNDIPEDVLDDFKNNQNINDNITTYINNVPVFTKYGELSTFKEKLEHRVIKIFEIIDHIDKTYNLYKEDSTYHPGKIINLDKNTIKDIFTHKGFTIGDPINKDNIITLFKTSISDNKNTDHIKKLKAITACIDELDRYIKEQYNIFCSNIEEWITKNKESIKSKSIQIKTNITDMNNKCTSSSLDDIFSENDDATLEKNAAKKAEEAAAAEAIKIADAAKAEENERKRLANIAAADAARQAGITLDTSIQDAIKQAQKTGLKTTVICQDKTKVECKQYPEKCEWFDIIHVCKPKGFIPPIGDVGSILFQSNNSNTSSVPNETNCENNISEEECKSPCEWIDDGFGGKKCADDQQNGGSNYHNKQYYNYHVMNTINKFLFNK